MLGVPLAVAGLLAIPLSLWRGDLQWLCAGVAVALVVPPGLVTLILAIKLSKSWVLGPHLALTLGTLVRLLVSIGGAVVVYATAKSSFNNDAISFFAWLLGVYLVSLVTEIALLANVVRVSAGIKGETANRVG
jgi:hypothetical protein